MVGHRGPRPEAQGCRGLPELRGEGGPRVPTGGKARNASRLSLCDEQPDQNWYGQGESDCLIKTKHCDGPKGF